MKLLHLILLFLVFCCPDVSYAEGVIGRDTLFNIAPIQVLTGNAPYNDVFNYFFTLELFFGLFALFIRLILKPLKS